MRKLFILFLILPTIVFAESSIMMSPSRFDLEETRPLKAGGEYQLAPDFWIYNGLEETTTYKISVECFANRKEICPPEEHFVFEPQTFTLNPNEGQKVKAKIVIPRDYQNFGKHFCVVQAQPFISADIEGTGATLGIAIGSKISYVVAGKLAWWKVIANWFSKNISNKVYASVSNLGFSKNIAFIIFGFVGAGIISQKAYKRFKPKPKRIIKRGNTLDLSNFNK